MSNVHKLQRIISTTRLGDNSIDYTTDPVDIIEKSEKLNLTHSFQKDIYFYPFKTEYKGQQALMLLFAIKIGDSIVGSSATTKVVIELINHLENVMDPPITDLFYLKILDNKILKRPTAMLKVIQVNNPNEGK